jgi:hypothetical protein
MTSGIDGGGSIPEVQAGRKRRPVQDRWFYEPVPVHIVQTQTDTNHTMNGEETTVFGTVVGCESSTALALTFSKP